MVRLIENGTVINEGRSFTGSLLVRDEAIEAVLESSSPNYYRKVEKMEEEADDVVDAAGLYVIPGLIDDQVHFREPGATWKGDIESESHAAALGGVTSYIDMPNNNPPAVTSAAVAAKHRIAERCSKVNYSFYLGATNDNIDEVVNADVTRIPGVKVFMGSSTGNMLVDNPESLEAIFKLSPLTILTHCEKQFVIDANMAAAKKEWEGRFLIPYNIHERIRSREACVESTAQALRLALKYGSSLHVLHLSTADEVKMIEEAERVNAKISAEICVQYLVLDDTMYERFGPLMKCNPSVKGPADKLALRSALNKGVVKVVATDHAPHLFSEKDRGVFDAPSGVPLVQNSLQIMLELCRQGVFTMENVVAFMCHNPALRFGIEGRGFLRKGYKADITIFDYNRDCRVVPASRAGWSLFSRFGSTVLYTFVNGTPVVENGRLTLLRNSQPLVFRK